MPETNVSNNASQSMLARLVADNSDNVHFVWRDESPQGFGIWYAKLANDGGVVVPSHLAVSGAGAIGISTFDFEIALNKYQEVNVSWDEGPSGYNQMDYTKLDSLGDTLIAKVQVTPINIDAGWVGIGVDSFASNHLACRTDSGGISNRLTYSKLDKDGNFLVYNKVLATGGNNAIVSDRQENIHIIYTNPAGPGNRIDYLKLDNGGNILIGPITISPSQYSCTYSHMAIDSLQYLHIVWQADSSAVFHIMYCKLDTLGNYVVPPMKIVYPPYTTGAGEPRIAADHHHRLHVVWLDNRLGNQDIFYKRGENENTIMEIEQRRVANLPKLTIFPNPFHRETKITFFVSQETKKAWVEIYDASGRLVKTFDRSPINQFTWDGTDSNGQRVPVGVYFVQGKASGITTSRKVVKLR